MKMSTPSQHVTPDIHVSGPPNGTQIVDTPQGWWDYFKTHCKEGDLDALHWWTRSLYLYPFTGFNSSDTDTETMSLIKNAHTFAMECFKTESGASPEKSLAAGWIALAGCDQLISSTVGRGFLVENKVIDHMKECAQSQLNAIQEFLQIDPSAPQPEDKSKWKKITALLEHDFLPPIWLGLMAQSAQWVPYLDTLGIKQAAVLKVRTEPLAWAQLCASDALCDVLFESKWGQRDIGLGIDSIIKQASEGAQWPMKKLKAYLEVAPEEKNRLENWHTQELPSGIREFASECKDSPTVRSYISALKTAAKGYSATNFASSANVQDRPPQMKSTKRPERTQLLYAFHETSADSFWQQQLAVKLMNKLVISMSSIHSTAKRKEQASKWLDCVKGVLRVLEPELPPFGLIEGLIGYPIDPGLKNQLEHLWVQQLERLEKSSPHPVNESALINSLLLMASEDKIEYPVVFEKLKDLVSKDIFVLMKKEFSRMDSGASTGANGVSEQQRYQVVMQALYPTMEHREILELVDQQPESPVVASKPRI